MRTFDYRLIVYSVGKASELLFTAEYKRGIFKMNVPVVNVLFNHPFKIMKLAGDCDSHHFCDCH
jgi:hypothetical protein